MSSNDCGVVIVGAGPAGCMTAINLTEEYKVLIVESSSLPRDKNCAGMLKLEAFNVLKKYGLPEKVFSNPRTLTPRGVDVSAGRELVANTRYYNVDRKALDGWLLELAESNPKVEVWSNAHLIKFEETGDGLCLDIRKNGRVERVNCRLLVGADGAASGVARALGENPSGYYMAVTETFAARGVERLSEFVGFIGKDIPYYHWVVPKGQKVQVGGVFKRDDRDIRDKFASFKEIALETLGIEPLETSAPKGHPITTLESVSEIRPGRGRVLLVGEAARLVDPSILEGITYALMSGELCARAIRASKSDPLSAYDSLLAPIKRRIFKQIIVYKIYRSKWMRLLAQNVMPQVRVERTI